MKIGFLVNLEIILVGPTRHWKLFLEDVKYLFSFLPLAASLPLEIILGGRCFPVAMLRRHKSSSLTPLAFWQPASLPLLRHRPLSAVLSHGRFLSEPCWPTSSRAQPSLRPKPDSAGWELRLARHCPRQLPLTEVPNAL
jgi:hypothetical protein